MPRLTDPTILALIQLALSNWRFTGYVTVKNIVRDWIIQNLNGIDVKVIAKAMYDHMQAGGAVDQVVETRPEWSIYPYHYDFRLPLGGRLVYIETVLRDDIPNDPILNIVSMHDV